MPSTNEWHHWISGDFLVLDSTQELVKCVDIRTLNLCLHCLQYVQTVITLSILMPSTNEWQHSISGDFLVLDSTRELLKWLDLRTLKIFVYIVYNKFKL
jgi:hypothetical protein